MGKPPNYHLKSYWDNRYAEQGDQATFDWHNDYSGLKEVLQQMLRFNSVILNIGSGSSGIPEALYDDGYKRITNVDFSGVCIASMSNRNRELRGEMTWIMTDMTKGTTFQDDQFDFVLDKGLMDAAMCAENPQEVVASILKEVGRVVKPASKYVIISVHPPRDQLELLMGDGLLWKPSIKLIPKATAPKLMKGELDNFTAVDVPEDEHGRLKLPKEEDEQGMLFMYILTRLKASEVAAAEKKQKPGRGVATPKAASLKTPTSKPSTPAAKSKPSTPAKAKR